MQLITISNLLKFVLHVACIKCDWLMLMLCRDVKGYDLTSCIV